MPWVNAQRLGRERLSIGDKQEEMPINCLADEAPKKEAHSLKRRPAPPPPFRFGYRRQPIDWRVLHGIDIHRMVRETDIETLERCVGAVAFGDLEAEDSRNLTEVNFMRIFRLGQLTAEYLLHVQDRLAYDNILLKDEKVIKEKRVMTLKGRCKQQKDALDAAKLDIQRLKKTIKTLEAAALQDPPVAVPLPMPGVSPAEGDISARLAWKQDMLQQQIEDLKAERAKLLHDLAQTKSDLCKSKQQGRNEVDSEVARVRSDERTKAQQRLRAAHNEAEDLRRKLDTMLERQIELQQSKKSEVEDLDGTLQSLSSKQHQLQKEVQILRDELAQKEQLLDELRLKAEEDSSKAEAQIRELEDQLYDATEDLNASSEAVSDVGSLQQDIAMLKAKVRLLKEEHSRIKSENSGLLRKNSELDVRLKELRGELENKEGAIAEEEERAAEEQARLDKEREAQEKRDKQEREAQARRAQAESRAKSRHARSASVPAKLERQSSSEAEVPSIEPGELPVPSASRPWAREGAPPVPARALQAKWKEEHPHEMRPWDRPGALSRTSIARTRFMAQRPEIQELLETELREELQSYGIDPDKGKLSEEQYDTAMKELANRQAAAAADTGPETAEKVKGLREALAWHLHKVADEVDAEFIILPNGQVAAQQKPPPPARRHSPGSLRRSRSASPKKSSGLLGKLCCRFRSPSHRQRRQKEQMSQAAAIAAYRDTYGHDPIGLRYISASPRSREADKLKDASERFYQPLLTGTRSLSQEQLPALYPSKSPGSKLRPIRTKGTESHRPRPHTAAPRERQMSPAVEMTTAKKMAPSKAHATIRKPTAEAFKRQSSSSLEEEDILDDTANSPKDSKYASSQKQDAMGNKPSSSHQKDLPSRQYLSKLMEGV